jgi:hypothetical protein
MLNKEICDKCYENNIVNRSEELGYVIIDKEGKYQGVHCPKYDGKKSKDDFIYCPQYNFSMKDNPEKSGENALKKCPYKLEHIMKESK